MLYRCLTVKFRCQTDAGDKGILLGTGVIVALKITKRAV
jgi:hypothetical protein